MGEESAEEGGFQITTDQFGRMKKLKIAKTVNDEIKLSNFMQYKSVFCKHYQSCFWYQMNGVFQNFLKGAFMAGYASFLIVILKSKRDSLNLSLLDIFKELFTTQKKLMCRMGCMAGSFTFLHKLFLCLLRSYFQQTTGALSYRSFPFFAGCKFNTRTMFILTLVFASILTLPAFFPRKSIRKVLLLLALTLSFECIFKFVFRYQRPHVNDFQRCYKREVRPDGHTVVNTCVLQPVTSQYKHRVSVERALGDYTTTGGSQNQLIDNSVDHNSSNG